MIYLKIFEFVSRIYLDLTSTVYVSTLQVAYLIVVPRALGHAHVSLRFAPSCPVAQLNIIYNIITSTYKKMYNTIIQVT